MEQTTQPSRDNAAAVTHELYFPPELVEQIMRNLDGKTFINCRRVCKIWRQIVDRLSQESEIWEKFCVTEYPDIWESIYDKGILLWSDVYANICLWKKIGSARAKNIEFQNFSNNFEEQIVAVNINKGGSLNVTLKNSIKIYDIKTLKEIEEIIGQYFYYFENEFTKMIHSGNHTLHIKPSIIYNSDEPHDSMFVDNVYLFRIFDGKCYYVTLKQELYVFNLKNNNYKPSFLVRWYNSDSIIALDCHKDKVYLLTNTGKILTPDNNRLILDRNVKWPYKYDLYQKFYLYRGNIFFYCDYSNLHISIPNGEEAKYTKLHVSGILLHGNVLVIGTYYGLVYIFSINRIKDLLRLDKIPMAMTHLLNVEFPLAGFEIYEEPKSHSLFAWTRSNIYLINYLHETNNCAEKTLCDKFKFFSVEKYTSSNDSE